MGKKLDRQDKTYPIGPTLRRLLQNAWTKNPRLFGAFAMFTLTAAIYPLLAVLMPRLVLEELTRPDGARLSALLLTVGAVLLASSVLGYVSNLVRLSTYTKITAVRLGYISDVCAKLLGTAYCHMEDATFFSRYDRALEAPSSNSNGIEGVYHELFEGPAEALSALALALLIGARSPWILLAILVHVAALTFIGRRTHAYEHSRREDIGRANRHRQYYLRTTHDFGFGKDIRIYSLKDRVLDNYRREIKAYVAIHSAIAGRRFALGFLGLLTLLVSDAVTYGILIRDTVNGLPIAEFSMYLTAVAALSALLKTVSDRVAKVLGEGHYVYDFFRFLDTDLGAKGGDLPAVKGDTLQIEFRDVSFRYPGTERFVIRHLDLTIHKGERLAIVGVNGAGKSTLVKLMCGLFDVTEGELLINGRPIGEYDKAALYSMFSVVFQDVHVLAFPLVENVTCRQDGDRERAALALDRAGLSQKVKALPKGIDQPMLKVIEEDGTEFSGGESQKLAIARALYKGGNMVIMDEPTAALDALAEAEIYEHFSDLVAGKTAVYISHRLASTKFCDKIAFFDADGLKEYGTHEELMALGGGYYHMFTVQGKYYNESLQGGA